MAVGGRAGGPADVRLNDAAIRRLIGTPAGPVGAFLSRFGEVATQFAKRNAPVGDRSSKSPDGWPSGHLRSEIGWDMHTDGGDLVVDIYSPAVLSPANLFHAGSPYGLYVERPDLRPYGLPHEFTRKDGPYLEPAFWEALQRLLG